MSIVYLAQGENRVGFIQRAFAEAGIREKATGKRVLLKPNIVSHEPYPTTTHPETVETCIRLLLPVAREIIVADGSAPDAGDTASIIRRHPLRPVCDRLGVTITDLFARGTTRVKAHHLELEVPSMAFECNFIMSLPVLKSHSVCNLTGALKNHIGFLSPAEKSQLHWGGDVHQTIAELHQVIKADFYVVDAIETLIITNEVRHGGRKTRLGYMLAGTDPVSLDVAGLELLRGVEPRLRNKLFNDIQHIRHSISLGVGSPDYRLIKLAIDG